MISSAALTTPLTEFENPFSSFWMAGFECTDKLNAFGNRVDFLSVTGHIDMLSEDYQRLHSFHIRTVREGIRWSQVEKRPYHYDWSTVGLMIREAKANNIQQVWDICHFGFPDDLTPLHPLFPRRFASLCRAFADFYHSLGTGMPLIVTPINEVSFLAWLGGEARGTSPYCTDHGWEVKYSLMRAYIEGVAALKEVDPRVIILSTEPLVQIAAPQEADAEELEIARLEHEEQYQAMDILTGRMCPELGGSIDYVDIIGLNFYYNNQWISGTKNSLPWNNVPFDPRWQPLHKLIREAYHRYQKPVVLAETSHPGEDRPDWIQYVTGECATLVRQGIPFWGICLYPIIDRPDWDHFSPWHASGLWDALHTEEGPPQRVLCQPYASALRECQQVIDLAKQQGNMVLV